jgi:hypothetical protein
MLRCGALISVWVAGCLLCCSGGVTGPSDPGASCGCGEWFCGPDTGVCVDDDGGVSEKAIAACGGAYTAGVCYQGRVCMGGVSKVSGALTTDGK